MFPKVPLKFRHLTMASISPLSIIGNLYYPFCMGLFALLSILLRYPKKYS